MKDKEIVDQLADLFLNTNNKEQLQTFLKNIAYFWVANIDWTKQKSLLEKIQTLTSQLEFICSSKNINVKHIDLKLRSDNSEYFEIEKSFSTGSFDFDMALRHLHPYLYALAPDYIDKNFITWTNLAVKEHQHWFNGSFLSKTFGMVYIPSNQSLDISFKNINLTSQQFGLLFAAIFLPIPMISAEKDNNAKIKELCSQINHSIRATA
jgi:hypothetical protein